MSKSLGLGFLGLFLLCGAGCYANGDLQQPIHTETGSSFDSDNAPVPDGCGCKDLSGKIVGKWDVKNHGTGAVGQVSFKTDGTYTIDTGSYNAGGTWNGATSGKYKTLPAGGIAFSYGAGSNINRIAATQFASSTRIVHVTLGHSHDDEELIRIR